MTASDLVSVPVQDIAERLPPVDPGRPEQAATLGRVLDALRIPPRQLTVDGKGAMRRQADVVSQDWVDRFRQEDLDPH